jgi:beta-lactamase class D
MKTLIFFFILCLVIWYRSLEIHASESLIITRLESGEILVANGEITSRTSPCSTFKIFLSLIGYDAGILQNELLPQWPYNEKYQAANGKWKRVQNPRSWIQNSCVWYSKELVKRVGFDRFKRYLKLVHYGNEDIFPDFTSCWLSSNLKIAPQEQVDLLTRLLKNELPFSYYSQEMTRKILFVQDITSSFKLFGKVGTGFQENGFQMGWFVGWAEKGTKRIIFSLLIKDQQDLDFPAGFRAKEKIINLLLTKDFFCEN